MISYNIIATGSKSHVVWWLPAIDDTVVCLYLPCFNADGFVLGGIYP